MDFEQNIKNMIKQHLGVTNVKNNSSLIDDLGANNLDIVELIMSIEEKFDVEIPDEKIKKLITVQDIIDYIKNKSNE